MSDLRKERVAEVFYTPQEVADLLNLRVDTVYEYIRSGKLPAARFGNRYRIDQIDLDAFVTKARALDKQP